MIKSYTTPRRWLWCYDKHQSDRFVLLTTYTSCNQMMVFYLIIYIVNDTQCFHVLPNYRKYCTLNKTIEFQFVDLSLYRIAKLTLNKT
jgi:hypothetical protein